MLPCGCTTPASSAGRPRADTPCQAEWPKIEQRAQSALRMGHHPSYRESACADGLGP